VRIGIHRGPVTISGGEYLGLTVHEVSRICAAAHGGQIVCSSAVVDALGWDHAGRHPERAGARSGGLSGCCGTW
jgi:class 3 adenylate cyclase